MIGITIDSYHTFEDFGLILTNRVISVPEIKTQIVELIGADGVLDLTEAFGVPKYKNRELTFKFTCVKRGSDFQELLHELNEKFHGKKLKIILDDESDFYYFGRISVSNIVYNIGFETLEIHADCEPYVYKLNKTSVVGTGNIDCYNLKKSVTPIFYTTENTVIQFNDESYNLGAGAFTVPEIVFGEGLNRIVSDKQIRIEYQEGRL